MQTNNTISEFESRFKIRFQRIFQNKFQPILPNLLQILNSAKSSIQKKIFLTTFLGLALCSSFIILNCQTASRKNQNSIVGYKLLVDYPDGKEVYVLAIESIQGNQLSDILAGFSLQQNPSMRFVTTSQSIEIMDVLGTRNTLQYAWRLYVDYKEVSPTELKKSKPIQLNNIIQLKYLPPRKILSP